METLKMSNQMMVAIMFALQTALAEQSDLVPVFQAWDFTVDNGELYVKNPPAYVVPEEHRHLTDDSVQNALDSILADFED